MNNSNDFNWEPSLWKEINDAVVKEVAKVRTAQKVFPTTVFDTDPTQIPNEVIDFEDLSIQEGLTNVLPRFLRTRGKVITSCVAMRITIVMLSILLFARTAHADLIWSDAYKNPMSSWGAYMYDQNVKRHLHERTQEKGAPPAKRAAPLEELEEQATWAQSQVPFVVEPNKRYVHPKRPDVVLVCAVYDSQVLVGLQVGGKMIPFDATTLKPVWTQLNAPQGPLPVSLLSHLPGMLYALWL